MKIDHSLVSATLERKAGTRQESDPALHQCWRRALEQAQWEERAHYEARPTGGGQDPREAGGQGAVTSRNAATRPAEVQWQARGLRELPLPPTEHASHGSTSSGAQSIRIEHSAPAQIGVGQAPAERRPPLAAAGVGAVRATVLLPGEPPQWLPTALVVNVQGQQVRASLRDPEADAACVFHQLRAQLAAHGLELVELMVNGQVLRAGPGTAPPIEEKQHGS